MSELRDKHREVSAPTHCRRPARVPVGGGESSVPACIGAGELEEHAPELLARVSRPTVLPVDDAHSAVRGRQDVVGPQIAVAGSQRLRWLDPGLQRDELITQISQPGSARRLQFVVEGWEIVACGGWSRRYKLYTGSGDAAEDRRLLDPSREPARVRAMFVRGDWTRRGLGRAILESSARAARAEGCTSMSLGATLPGVPLYRAFGFREIEKFMVTMPDGVSVDAIAMERPLTAKDA